MALSRANSLKKSNPLLHFKQFQQNLAHLKQEVEIYNKRENYSDAMNACPQASQSEKRFLKKMTEPKYHKVVLNMIQDKQKSQGTFQRKNSLKGFKSLVYTSILKKSQQIKDEQMAANISVQLSQTQRLKRDEIKQNIRKKQKQLEKQWSMLDEYRSQHSMFNTERSGWKTKKERIIIKKVMQNRPQTHSSTQSEYFTRNNTSQSECLQMR